MQELQQPSSLALRIASQPLLALSGKQLSEGDGERLLTLLEQTAARYPHQNLAPAMEGYLHDFGNLALRYGMDPVQSALEELRIMPGRLFFPQPSEVAEVIEEMAAKAKTQAYGEWKQCSRCENGMLVVEVERDGKKRFEAVRCECWKQWKQGIQEGRKDNL